ncbi:MAG: hypothetical protein ACTSPI_17525, partial [Candidatus Heimdallarchaeaceae archaeon]
LLTYVKAWKRRTMMFFTSVQNFDGSYAGVFLDNVMGLIEQYHDKALARYGEIIKDNPEMITRMSAGTQSLLLSRITEEIIDIENVPYMELSKDSTFSPKSKAIDIFMNDETWKPKGEEARGPLFISQVFFILDALNFAYKYYIKSLLFHAERQSNPKKYPDYKEEYSNYIFTNYDQEAIPFNQNNEITLKDQLLQFLAKIYPQSIDLDSLSESFAKPKNYISSIISRLVKADLITRVENGIYIYNTQQQQTTALEEKK